MVIINQDKLCFRMGITGLLPFLSNISRKKHLSDYQGKRIAIDASCWLHRGAFACAFELSTGIYNCTQNLKLTQPVLY